MKKHFVTFLSPGTFVAEQTTKEIDFWNTAKAIEMSKEIKERYGAVPYGFRFSTRARKEGNLDSKVVKESGVYYLGGKVMALKDIQKRNDPSDEILISNMKCNGWDRVIVNDNSWRWTQPFGREDVLISDGRG